MYVILRSVAAATCLGGLAHAVSLAPAQAKAEPPATKHNYSYPKTDDQLLCFIAKLTHKLNSTSDTDLKSLSWYDSELLLWMRTQAFMEKTAKHDYLDIGCGMGRIVSKFGGLFKSTTCLEPDGDRITLAKDSVAHEHFPGQFNFVNSRFLEYDFAPESFDVVTCMQVIQHLPTEMPAQWFQRMYTLLRPNGVLIVSTTVQKLRSFLVKMPNGDVIPISDVQFNFVAKHTKDNGALPVHHWTPEEFAALARSTGFEVLEQASFSYMGAFPMSQYIVMVKPGAKVPVGAASPPVASIHLSGLEEISLGQVSQIRAGVDKRCGVVDV